MFIGDLADKAGRRPAYITCFIIYLGANIGLALQDSYAALFVLRCMQSAGSSTTIALSCGIVADVAIAAERGTYMGIVQAGSLLGPSIGPVIGGLLTQYLGWRSIFWFLVIFAGVFMVVLLLFLPETARQVVGNGSIAPPKWDMTVISYVRARRAAREQQKQDDGLTRSATSTDRTTPFLTKLRRIRLPNPLKTLSIVFQKDTFIILISNAIVFAAFYDVSAVIPSIYGSQYGLDELQIGLCYIPFGLGACIASYLNGKLLDLNYRRMAKRLGFPIVKNRDTDLTNFPIDKVRLEIAFPLITISSMTVIAFGWFLNYGIHLAAPTTILFLSGFCMTGSFNTVSTLLIDLYPSRAATATAANNFVRCLLGAGATAVVNPMMEGMGRGWCFTFIGLVMLTTIPLLMIVIRFGSGWRAKRREKNN